jgi:hypothetical protein
MPTVELFVDDLDQLNILEVALDDAQIPYHLSMTKDEVGVWGFGLATPYLVVDGVPLDTSRSLTWIKEHCNGN